MFIALGIVREGRERGGGGGTKECIEGERERENTGKRDRESATQRKHAARLKCRVER